MLDSNQCREARLSKDPRFDGAFFTVVHSTGIFCRPICPARAPNEENVSYVLTAADAMQQGFRPCFRCRPETAPNSPAWKGVETTASRAFDIINSGYLAEHSVEQLSDRLGISSRYLRKLCQQYYSVTPVQLESSRRLMLAKRLVLDSDATMTDIASLSGYASLRRFNEAFKMAFEQPPSHFRKTANGMIDASPLSPKTSLYLALPSDYDFDSVLNFLRRRQLDDIELIDSCSYNRTVTIDEMSFVIRVSMVTRQSKSALRIEISPEYLKALPSVLKLISTQFDITSRVPTILAYFAKDSVIGPMIAARPAHFSSLRMILTSIPFEAGIRAIVGQQVSVKGAITVLGRVIRRCGNEVSIENESLRFLFPTPKQLATANLDGLGLTQARINTLHAFSQAVVDCPELMDMNVDAQWRHQSLLAIKGVGPWTVNYLEMRGLAHLDAFPAGDLGIKKALIVNGEMATEKQAEQLSEAWRPWRAYAAMLLWHSLEE